MQEQLQKFQFPGFPPIPTTIAARTTRLLDARMANLIPLGTSLPLEQKSRTTLRDQDSYEAKVKKSGFKSDDTQKPNSGPGYHDIRAMSPSAVDQTYDGKKRPVSLPLENAKVDPPSLVLAGQSTASDLRYKLQPLRQSLDSETPTSLTAKPSLSFISSTDLIKHQMSRITDKNSYRPTPGSSGQIDQEEEHVTESDLETHASESTFRIKCFLTFTKFWVARHVSR